MSTILPCIIVAFLCFRAIGSIFEASDISRATASISPAMRAQLRMSFYCQSVVLFIAAAQIVWFLL